jgi:low temperature requirement protein LtrA
MALSLFVPRPWVKLIAIIVIICNYTPPFIAHRLLRKSSLDLSLSSSMAERLGLFTIIVFGEVVLGVVNGISKVNTLDFFTWLNFALAVSIVFALWWIFFAMTSNRNAKSGFVNATLLELLCIPTLMALGLIAARFSYLFDQNGTSQSLNILFGSAIAIFLIGISLIMGLLTYAEIFNSIKRPARLSLLVTALVLVAWSFVDVKLETLYYLLVVIVILLAEIIYLTSLYYNLNSDEGKKIEDAVVSE